MSRPSSRVAAVLAAVAIAASLLGTAVTAPPAAAFADGKVHIDGRGWGHGRGLGQYGSYGYAVNHGWSYSRILDHFYGGTRKGTRADGLIDVKLIYLDGTTTTPTDMTLTSEHPFQIGRAENAVAAGQWGRVRWNGDGWTIERAAACVGPWTEMQKLANADLQPEATTTYVGDDVRQMLTVLQPQADTACTQWNRRSYRGSLRIARLDTIFTRVLNRVLMEQYLRGVVPRESPASWGDAGGGKGIEALKSQSVAARSYAYAENRHPAFKTCDTTACQVYGGAGLNGLRTEDSRTDTAIRATAGEVRDWPDGRIVRTEFSSSTGGYTAGGTFPAVLDEGDATPNNPNHRWSAEVSVAAVEARFPQIGKLQSIAVLERSGAGPLGGWVRKVRYVGSDGSVERTGEQSRTDLGLRSAYYVVIDVPIDITRLEGESRFDTAHAIAGDVFPDGTASAVVLANANRYADAIVGVPLAVARNAPILLSDAESVPESTMAEIRRATGGAKPVYLLGGTAALSDAVQAQLEQAGYPVTRYGGRSRAETAVLVAEALGNPSTVLLATGGGFADALSAGAAAAEAGGAVLLTAGDEQAPETEAYLLRGTVTTRYAIGGAAATADPEAQELAGNDRYETALAVANHFFPGPVVAGMASGNDFADALGGGVHAAMNGGPLVLTDSVSLPVSTKRYVQGNAELTLRTLYVYGGPGAISNQVLEDLKKR